MLTEKVDCKLSVVYFSSLWIISTQSFLTHHLAGQTLIGSTNKTKTIDIPLTNRNTHANSHSHISTRDLEACPNTYKTILCSQTSLLFIRIYNRSESNGILYNLESAFTIQNLAIVFKLYVELFTTQNPKCLQNIMSVLKSNNLHLQSYNLQ